jgi:hypothetical protein
MSALEPCPSTPSAATSSSPRLGAAPPTPVRRLARPQVRFGTVSFAADIGSGGTPSAPVQLPLFEAAEALQQAAAAPTADPLGGAVSSLVRAAGRRAEASWAKQKEEWLRRLAGPSLQAAAPPLLPAPPAPLQRSASLSQSQASHPPAAAPTVALLRRSASLAQLQHQW